MTKEFGSRFNHLFRYEILNQVEDDVGVVEDDVGVVEDDFGVLEDNLECIRMTLEFEVKSTGNG